MLNDGAGHFSYAPANTFHTEPVYNTTDASGWTTTTTAWWTW